MVNELYELQNDIHIKNQDELFDTYFKIFEDTKNKFPKQVINSGKEFYRSRLGTKTMKGVIHDYDIDIEIAFYNEDLGNPPPLITKGGALIKKVSLFYI